MDDATGDVEEVRQLPKPFWQRLVWFVALWALGAGLLWIISLVIRWAVVPE